MLPGINSARQLTHTGVFVSCGLIKERIVMKKKKVIMGSVILLILGVFVFSSLSNSLQAQEQVFSPGVSAQLEEILGGQRQILEGLEAIKKQLAEIQIYTNKL